VGGEAIGDQERHEDAVKEKDAADGEINGTHYSST
jgi:hypothetical protein